MAASDLHLAIALTILLITIPSLVLLARFLTAPWRTLAARYPASKHAYTRQLSYVMARFWGIPRLPFGLTRCIRIRSSPDMLAISVLGFDFPPAKLLEINIPRRAIRECVPCDTLYARQKLVLEDAAVYLLIYGRGAKFVRNWWNDGAQ